MVCGGAGQPFWHSLFPGGTSGLEASVDQPLVGEEFEFALAARRTTFPLPMQSGEDRAEENPLIRLLSPQPADCPVLVHARYEAAGRGLVLSLRSKERGILPVTELEWDNLKADTVSDEPPSLPQVRASLFPARNSPAMPLNSRQSSPALAPLPKLKPGLNSSWSSGPLPVPPKTCGLLRPQEWDGLQDREARKVVTDMLARLAFLLNARERELASRVPGWLLLCQAPR